MAITRSAFVRDFLKEIQDGNAAIFAGAGLSRSQGFIDWKGLLKEIAEDLRLDIDREHDLVAVAQYHLNSTRNRYKINQKILEEFVKDAAPSENHRILSRLPIHTFWTTNYDSLLEDGLKEAQRIADVKYDVQQLTLTRPRRDAVVYKMHGDVQHADKAIITKDDFETYPESHKPFVTALSGDLVSKTFLFLGCSFNDPNLGYVLSRVRPYFANNQRQHYIILKKVALSDIEKQDEKEWTYQNVRQELMAEDLKRYNIQTVFIDDYSEITEILKELEFRFRKKTVFVSGSAAEYGEFGARAGVEFAHVMSKEIVKKQFRIVNGFGLGIGSAVINGALETIYEDPQTYSEEQLIIKPFPQFATGGKELKQMWEEYRQRMIQYAGIAIFLFGNKIEGGKLDLAGGVRREYEIAKQHGLICLPVGMTGYVAHELWEKEKPEFEKMFAKKPGAIKLYTELGTTTDLKIVVMVVSKLLHEIIQD